MKYFRICFFAFLLALICLSQYSDGRDIRGSDEEHDSESSYENPILYILHLIAWFCWEIIAFLFYSDEHMSTQAPSTTTGILTTTEIPCTFELDSTLAGDNCTYGEQGKYCDECGLSFYEPNVKIVGGINARAHSWPSIVFITSQFQGEVNIPGIGVTDYPNPFGRGLCGGTLIKRDLVLTAAHCIHDKLRFEYTFANGTSIEVEGDPIPNARYPTIASMYTVYLGLQNNAPIFEDGEVNAQVVLAKEVKIHEDYNPVTFENDIAIIVLEEEVELNCDIQIACLPDPDIADFPTQTDVPVYAAGWGTLYSGGYLPDILQNVKLTLYDGSKCDDILGTPKDWQKQICAGELKGGKDTCQGDSGGPLYIQSEVNGKNKYVLAGVVSYGYGCGFEDYPGIYTRVSGYLEWIEASYDSFSDAP